MTYLEAFKQCDSEDELIEAMKREVEVALFIGGNPDRLKAIEDAANKVSAEKGW